MAKSFTQTKGQSQETVSPSNNQVNFLYPARGEESLRKGHRIKTLCELAVKKF